MRPTLLLLVMGLLGVATAASAADPWFTAASACGGSGGDERVTGAAVLSDGRIVLAGVIGDATPGGLTPTVIDGAAASSAGAVLVLAADGRSVLRVTRVADAVDDLAVDGSDRIYLAAGTAGAIVLDAQAATVVRRHALGYVHRIDAAGDGTYAALVPGSVANADSNAGAGTISVFAGDGTPRGSWAGKNNTVDLCVDPGTASVITIGWRQANAFDGTSTNPVQIAYLRAAAYDGTVQWTGYDWSTDPASPRFINRSGNNMADTRGLRVALGRDGKVYAAFEAAGGNSIFEHSPFDITASAHLVGGDQYHQFSASSAEHKTVFGRYDPATGALLRGQRLCARLDTGKANACRIEGGAIAADEAGRVYLAGVCGAGDTTAKTTPGLPFTFNPVPASAYGGGPFVLQMSADLTTRLACARVCSSSASRAVAARTTGGQLTTVFGGQWKPDAAAPGFLHVDHPFQAAPVGAADGFVAVRSAAPPQPGTIALAAVTARVGEEAGTVALTLQRTGGSAGRVSVAWATADGTATAGGDYAAASGTVAWADGDAAPKTISVRIQQDTLLEGDETVLVQLSDPRGDAALGAASATVTIVDDEIPPAGLLTLVGPVSVFESATQAQVTVQRIGGATGAVTIAYATADGTATAGADYDARSGTLSWADGDASPKTITIPLHPDQLVEGNEFLRVTLGAATGGAVLGTAVTTAWIIDDDALAVDVDFAPQWAAVADGFVADRGQTVAVGDGGWRMGWSRAVTTTGRDRNAEVRAPTAAQAHDTLLAMRVGNNDATWSIDLPAGSYDVTVCAGDPLYPGQICRIAANGVTVVDATTTADTPWLERTVRVEATAGRITLAPLVGASRDPLAFVRIRAVPSGVQ